PIRARPCGTDRARRRRHMTTNPILWSALVGFGLTAAACTILEEAAPDEPSATSSGAGGGASSASGAGGALPLGQCQDGNGAVCDGCEGGQSRNWLRLQFVEA